ncbi:hypothetical protein [Bacillus toyonensis]|uniref:hypothetical protein n=1 Tax=Bacillus toyonensis TaxID=155322 RepID=UPI0033054D03|nr:hypothetical protein [Bacillus toyonensis]
MIKALLVGTALSAGLFAGGDLGTEDVKKEEKATSSQTMDSLTVAVETQPSNSTIVEN